MALGRSGSTVTGTVLSEHYIKFIEVAAHQHAIATGGQLQAVQNVVLRRSLGFEKPTLTLIGCSRRRAHS